MKIFDEAGIYGSVRCHPSGAHLKHHPKMVAVGEMGQDLSREISDKEWRLQEAVLREQLEIAVNFLSKPIVIHARDAMIPCLRIVRDVVSAISS